MDATLRASLRLSKITFGDFVAALNPGYPHRVDFSIIAASRITR